MKTKLEELTIKAVETLLSTIVDKSCSNFANTQVTSAAQALKDLMQCPPLAEIVRIELKGIGDRR